MNHTRPLWMVTILLFVQMIIIAILLPGDWTANIIYQEREMLRNILSVEDSQWVEETSWYWYYKIMVETEAESAIHRFFIPSEDEKERSRGMQRLGEVWFVWVQGRLDALYNTLHQMIIRITLIGLWLPLILIFLIVVVIDATMIWRIKQTNFQYASPVMHRYSLQAVGVLFVVMLSGLLAPIVLPIFFFPAIMLVSIVILGLAIKHLQKRV